MLAGISPRGWLTSVAALRGGGVGRSISRLPASCANVRWCMLKPGSPQRTQRNTEGMEAEHSPVERGGSSAAPSVLPGFRFCGVIGPDRPLTHSMTTMKTMQNALLIAFATLAFTPAWAEEPAVKKDMGALQGEWSMVSGSADGQPMPDEMRTQMKRVCKGDEATVTMGPRVFLKAKFTIDPSKKPKTIDYQMIEGVTKGNTQVGIYEVDGDTFRSCFSAPGDPRPADFTSKFGDRRTVSVWQRQKRAGPDAK